MANKTEAELLQELIDLQKSGNTNRTSNKMQLSSGNAASTADDLKSFAKTLATEGTNIASAVGEQVNIWRGATDSGIGFNSDVIGLRASIGTTRLGVEEWSATIERGRQGLTSLGGSMGESAKAFNRLSYDFANTDAVDRLSQMGYSLKESNEVLMLSTAGKRIDVINDKEANKQARDSAEALAGEMDKVAQLTGVSRREQMSQLQEQQRDARLQATLEIELRRGGTEVADMYKKSSVQLQGMGLDKLGKELFTGQALSEKAIAQLNALGPAGTQLRNAMNAVRTARTAESRQQAEEMMKDAQAAVARRQNEDSYLALVQRGQGAVAEAGGEMYISAKNSREGIMAMQKELGKGATEEQARAELERRAMLAREGKDKDGNAVAGAASTELALKAQNRLKDATVIFAQIIEGINTQVIGKSPNTAKLIAEMENVKRDEKTGKVTAASERIGGEAIQSVPALLETGNFAKAAPLVIKEAVKQMVTEGIEIGKAIGKVLINDGLAIGKSMWAGFKEAMAGASLKDMLPGTTPTRDTGTLGMTGQLFEPKDFMGKVQKGETVLTPQQLENLVKGIGESTGIELPTEFKTIFQTIETNIKTMPKPADMQGQTELLNAVLTNVSAAMKVPQKEGVKPLDANEVMEKVKKDMSSAASQLKAEMSSNNPEALFQKAFNAQKMFGNLDAVIPNNPLTKTGEAAKSIPDSTKKAKEAEEAKKEEATKKATDATAPKASATANPTTTFAGKSTLDDLNTQLIQLNKTMGELVSYTAEVASSSEKQARALKRQDPNVALR
jgi:hypothetical protein